MYFVSSQFFLDVVTDLIELFDHCPTTEELPNTLSSSSSTPPPPPQSQQPSNSSSSQQQQQKPPSSPASA